MEDERSRMYITNHNVLITLITVEPLLQVVTQNVKPTVAAYRRCFLTRVTMLSKNFASSPHGNCFKCSIQRVKSINFRKIFGTSH